MTTTVIVEKPQEAIDDIKSCVEEFVKSNPITYDERGVILGGVADLFTDISCAQNHYANCRDYTSQDMNVQYSDPEGKFISDIQDNGTNVWDESIAKYKPDMSHPAIEHLEMVVNSFDSATTESGAMIIKCFKSMEKRHSYG